MNPKNTNNIEVGLYYDKFGHYQFNPLRTEAGGEGGEGSNASNAPQAWFFCWLFFFFYV